MIRHESDGWHVYSHDGSKHLGGPYPDKEQALERLRQVEHFKKVDLADTGDHPVGFTTMDRVDTDTAGVKGTVCKVDDSLGVVMGYAMVCKVRGEDYYDLQGDHITEDAMAGAALRFVEKYGSAAHVMHETKGSDGKALQPVGKVVFVYPLTTDVAKSMGIDAQMTGMLIGWKPNDRAVLEKFRSGEYRGFSIGGRILDGGQEIVP